MNGDGVLLIPGFFGFGTIGATLPDPLPCFDHVIDALVAERADLRGRIVAIEPPPTGALAARVSYLEHSVRDVLAYGIGPEYAPIDRLHLIGHSTGGLDARILINDHSAGNADIRRRIGAVVTVSAPLHGTPIATRFGDAFGLSVAGMSLLAIAAKAHEVLPPADFDARTLLIGLVADRMPNAALTRLLLELDSATAGDITRFLAAIVRHHDLLHDLTPASMRARNRRLAGGDYPGLRHVVTVAPPPPLLPFDGTAAGAVFRILYALVYTATADAAFTPRPFPSGPWLDGAPEGLTATAPKANDGIVPATSQTLAGVAHAIVEADHLDVIGHFASRRFAGTTVLKSDAAFNDAAFQRLWSTVGGMLR